MLLTFSLRRIKSFRAIREEENWKLANWIASNAGSPANLSARVHLSSFDLIMRSAVGSQAPDRAERFTWAVQETLKLASGFSLADLFPSYRFLTGINYKIAKIFWVTDALLQSILDTHRAADRDTRSHEDLVDVLLRYQQDDSLQFHLTTDTIKAVILDMLFGGTESNSTAVEWAMSEMIRNPSTLRRAQEEVRQVLDGKGYVDEDKFDEMKYLKLVIKGTLRLHHPVALLVPKRSSERCEINGYEIPANTRLMINAWSLGRDPKYWRRRRSLNQKDLMRKAHPLISKGTI